MLVFGTKVIYRTVSESVAHCERCGGDRLFRRRSGRRWAHLAGIPIYSLESTGEHVRCVPCRTCYRVDLLAVPTVTQMQDALLAGTSAAVLTMLHAADPASSVARRRAADLIRSAGAPEYTEQSLAADLAEFGRPSGPGAGPGAGLGLRQAVQTLAIQLEERAREWFLATVVQVGLAEGPLSATEREAVCTIARYLGMSPARADDIIAATEEAAQAG